MKAFFSFMMLAFLAMSFAPETVERPRTDPSPFDMLTKQPGAVYAIADADALPLPVPLLEYNQQPAYAMADVLSLPLSSSPLPAADKYAYGFRKAVTLTSSTAITVSPGNYTLTFAALAIDTAAAINATVTNSIVGDRIILKATADASNRTIDFTGNMVAVDDSVLATKTKVFEFIYDGTRFIQLSEIQID